MKPHILEVSRDLEVKPGLITTALYAGNREQYYSSKEIPKRNGKTRTIHAVHGRLRILQKVAYNWLSENYSPKSPAKGFIPGGGIIENAKIHRNKKLVICFDLKDFFPSITFARVQGMFMSYPFEFSKAKATLFAQICCLPDENGSIPQGGVTSPYISNMICRRLDERMQKLAIKHRMRYSRYADDLSFSTNDNVNFKKFKKIVAKIIKNEHFELNDKKTRLLTKSDRQAVTGIVVNEGLNVNRRYIRSLRATLYNCYKDGVLSQIEKEPKFKSPWNSCPPIYKGEYGIYIKYKNNEPIKSIYDAKEIFMQHLFGRIQFIRHVAQSNKGLNIDHYQKRNDIYINLLEMFEKVRSKEKITGQIKVQAKIALFQDQDRDLLKELEQYSPKQLNEFVLEKKNDDPRFFVKTFPTGQIDKYRKEVIEFVKYPKPDINKVMDYLNQLIDSDSHVLGKLVHDNNVSMHDFNNFRYQLEKDKRFFPKRFREDLDKFINTDIMQFIRDKDINFNTFSDESFVSNTVHPFKKGTRFANVTGNVQADETDLVNLIETLFKQAEASQTRQLNYDISELRPLKFYTHVPSIKYALNRIIQSMFDNSNGSVIKCKIDPDNYILEISDDNIDPLSFSPNRNFLSGKLRTAIFHLNALCEYYIEANFSDGGWQNINMMKNEVNDSEERTGFTHILKFHGP